LQKATYDTNRRFRILDDISHTRSNGFRNDGGGDLGEGFEDEPVELMIESEKELVDGPKQIGRGRFFAALQQCIIVLLRKRNDVFRANEARRITDFERGSSCEAM
jgi:hypothetical protein